MRGVLSWGVHLPYRRLDRSTIAAVAGSGGGRGHRTVAGFDEDATTMAVAASRDALAASPAPVTDAVWFATASPPYLDKTNAAAVHAALRLADEVPAYDALGSIRSGLGALRSAFRSTGVSLVATADLRVGLPGGPDEATVGDAGAAIVIGSEDDGPLLAELVSWTSATEEFLDRWRRPGQQASRVWEERFGETRYVSLGVEAFGRALEEAGLDASQVDHLVVTGAHERAAGAVAKKSGVASERVADTLGATVGNTGTAHPALQLAATLERATPGQLIALVALADGADVVLLRTTEALAQHTPRRPVADQIEAGAPVSYGKYLAWRGLLPVEPPRRPEPARPSASAASRSEEWKFGFVGSQAEDGTVHLPPAPLDDVRQPMADAVGTVAAFTVDRLAYSPSPPVVFAVIDFDGGGRLPMELTDVDADQVEIGMRVELTFRNLFTSDDIHNYFWKARPVRTGAPVDGSN